MTSGMNSVLVIAHRVIKSFEPLVIIEDGAVGVRGSRIDWIGPAAAMSSDNYDSILHLGNASVMPGLMDSHVHLSFNAANDPVGDTMSSTADQQREEILANGQRFLDSGVTTVRDLGAPPRSVLAARELVFAGSVLGPTILAADQPLTRPHGHLWQLAMEVGTTRDVALAIEELAARRVDVCKVMVTGGRMTPGTDPNRVEMDIKLLSAVTRLAHAHRLPVAAHCLSTDGIIAAVRAGVDTIEHGTFIDSGDTPHDEKATVELIKRIAAAGISVCPTLSRERGGIPHPIRFDQRARWVQLLLAHGVNVALGNDTGIPGQPPERYIEGLKAFKAAGLGLAGVLHLATTAAANAMQIASEVGTLDEGKRADLLGVDGNPLDELEVLVRPLLVMARGQTVATRQSPAFTASRTRLA